VRSGRSFDGLAESYDRREALAGDPLETWLQAVLPCDGKTAVDLACGAGRHSILLAQRYDHVLAVDISGEMIELAKQRRPAPNIAYRHADLLDIDGRFDLVFCSSALHDIDDLDRALAHVRALVSPGGTALLADVVGGHSPQRRWWLHVVAFLHLPVDLLRQPRSALELYRLAREPAWIAHLATDRYLTRAELERRYRRHFPDATFSSAKHLHTCRWTSVGP